MSDKLVELLKEFKDDWEALERELKKLVDELRTGDRLDFPGLDPRAQVPFVRLMLDEVARHAAVGDPERKQVLETTIDMVERMRQELSRVGFWKNDHAREVLTRQLVRDLDRLRTMIPRSAHRDLAQRLVALAKENHEHLKRR